MTKISPGDRFGHWTVLAPSKERPYYFTCRCDCGTVKDVYRSSLLQGTSTQCPACAFSAISDGLHRSVREKAAADLLAAQQRYTGQTVNGWRILEVLPAQGPRSGFCCKAVCPKCGKPTVTRLSRIRQFSPIRQCAACNRDIKKKSDAIHSTAWADGSSLVSVKSRMSGATNRNSTTGANGVSRLADGRYRAYINFKRKQVFLGKFSSLEDAVAARKAAEQLIYGEYLDQNAGWEEDLKEAIEKLKKK